MHQVVCSKCGPLSRLGITSSTVEVRFLRQKALGQAVLISGRIRVCNKCGLRVYDTLLDRENLIKAYEHVKLNSTEELEGDDNGQSLESDIAETLE